MTYLEITNRVAKKCNLRNAAGTFVDGQVTQTDLKEYINERYQDLFLKLSEMYPENFTMTAYADTQADVAKYSLEGDASDKHVITYVGIKYNSTDTKYRRVRKRRYDDLFKEDDDTSDFTESGPYYNEEAAKETSEARMKTIIRITPPPTAEVTDGLKLRYVELQLMSEDSHTPTGLPTAAHKLLISFVIADVWEQKGNDGKADKALNRALLQEERFFKEYQPMASDEPVRMIPDRSFNPLRKTR